MRNLEIMGRKAASKEKKIEVASFLEVCKCKAEIERRTGVSRHAVRNIAKKIANGEPLDNRTGQGRHRVSSAGGDRQLKRLSNQQRRAGSRNLVPQRSCLLGRQVRGLFGAVSFREESKVTWQSGPFRTRAQIKKR